MEAQLHVADTYPAEDFVKSFVRRLPTDSRFLQNSYQKFPPTTSIDADTINFDLNRYDSANFYQIQAACLKVQCKIVKANGDLPSTERRVWPVNNVLHSLFSSVRVLINEQVVTNQPDHYPYKALIANEISYSGEYKAAQLSTVGYYKETFGHMTNADYDVNSAFQLRNRLFREDNDDTKPYSPEGAKFFGRLQLDFTSLDTGVPPGTKIQIQLTKSSDKFMLMKEAGDPEEYRIKITECYLYVPIAIVSAQVYNELSALIAAKSVALNFRRVEIRPLNIPREKIEFNSENLFPDAVPCRLIFAFVADKAKKGSYETNPFEFKRSWVVTEGDSLTQELSKEEILEREIKELRAKFALLEEKTSQIIQVQGNTRKGSVGSQGTLFGRLRSSFAEQGDGSSVSSESSQPPAYTVDPDPPAPKTKTVFIKKVELILNGTPVDQVILANKLFTSTYNGFPFYIH